MATAEDIVKLAALARISIPEAALPQMTKELDAILAYVGQLESLDLPSESDAAVVAEVRNVMRSDDHPHEGGAFTEALAEQFPQREGDALVVKQIVSHD